MDPTILNPQPAPPQQPQVPEDQASVVARVLRQGRPGDVLMATGDPALSRVGELWAKEGMERQKLAGEDSLRRLNLALTMQNRQDESQHWTAEQGLRERAQRETERNHRALEGLKAAGLTAQDMTTPAGIRLAAWMFLRTGEMVNMGGGPMGAKARAAVLAEASRMAGMDPGAPLAPTPGGPAPGGPAPGGQPPAPGAPPAGGPGPSPGPQQPQAPLIDPVVNKADLKAGQAALGKLTTQMHQVEAFESTALKNADLFVQKAQNVVGADGIPIANKYARGVALEAGDPAVVEYNTARQVALTEITRVLNSASATGVITDHARKEIQDMLPPGATLAQIQAAMGVLRQDMANRHESYRQQVEQIRGTVRNIPGGLSVPGQPAQGAQSHGAVVRKGFNKRTNKRVIEYADGFREEL